MKRQYNPAAGVLLFILITATVAILGYRFLRSKNPRLADRGIEVYALFQRVDELHAGSEVKINGLPVGTVTDMEPADEQLTAIKVIIGLSTKINIPANSVAYIKPGGFGNQVIIEKGNTSAYLQDGDTLRTLQLPNDSLVHPSVTIKATDLRKLVDEIDKKRKEDAALHADARDGRQ